MEQELDVMVYSPNFLKRTLSSIFLVPIVLFFLSLDKIGIFILLSIVCVILICELIKNAHGKVLYIGFVWVVLGALSFVMFFFQKGITYTFLVFLLVWINDIAAYFVGSLMKGPKIAPSISPNKTYSGLMGGLVFSTVLGLLSVLGGWTSLCLSFAANGGDLLESYGKRLCGIKDSGTLIPGHGGLFDRIDGALCAFLMAEILYQAGIL